MQGFAKHAKISGSWLYSTYESFAIEGWQNTQMSLMQSLRKCLWCRVLRNTLMSVVQGFRNALMSVVQGFRNALMSVVQGSMEYANVRDAGLTEDLLVS